MIWDELTLPPINLYNAPKRKDSHGESTRSSSRTFCGN